LVDSLEVEDHDAEPAAVDGSNSGDAGTRSFGARLVHSLRWLFWRHLCFGGLAGALVFFCASLLPSLLPRGVILQGVLSGVTVTIGYGIGSGISSGIRKARSSEPSPRTKRIAWWILIGATIVLIPLFLLLGRSWQNDVRSLMGMDALEVWKWGAILVVTVIVALLVLLIARVVRALGHGVIWLLDRWLPRRVSAIGGVVLTIIVVIGLIQGFLLDPALSALNSAYSVINTGTEDGVTQPTQPERSGSPASLVKWSTLGVQGRDFTGIGKMLGPSVQQLTDFNGTPAKEPIRVYVGLESADSLQKRVDLALAELDRTHAWSRKVITVFTTTGTGWVDERAASPIEYMYNGDSAEVAMQYSYLPSWISFLVDVQKAADTGKAVIHAIQGRIDAMPKDQRPKLLLFGESLGSYGTEQAFTDVNQMISGVDGALLVGPVFRNHIHNAVTDGRDSGSPFWRPVYKNGAHVRFAVDPKDLAQPASPWSSPRIVYLQNSSDPITYWKLDLLWRRPEWLNDPRGPDVSSHMFWMPVATWWGTLGDMMFSTGVPAGHGHAYGPNPVDAWAAITQPPGWTQAKTDQLRAIVKDK
jgi:uncharacterized membrane protein